MGEMREILFRGKSFHTKEWVEGYLGIEVPDELVIQQFSFDDYFNSDCIDQYSVKPETVGQYTGLTDKNGTKIFEGDIVKFDSGEIMIINWDKDGAMFILQPEPYENYEFNCVLQEEIEVIGNIYDNPELLGGGKHEF